MQKKLLTTIYLVRHGQTEWNVKGLAQGHLDSSLTQEGIKQAQEISQKLKHIRFADIFSSDLLRAKRTADIVAQEHKLIVKTTKLLRERTFGKYEGKPYKDFHDAFNMLLKKYQNISDKEKTKLKLAQNIDSIDEIMSRLFVFLREIALSYINKKVLVITHGGVMRHLLIHLAFGNEKSLSPGSISNTAIIKLESDGVDFFVKETNGINKALNND
jgi:broad specificity phosphatase PhoE